MFYELFDRYDAIIAFDTETSGLDFEKDQIIELAALRLDKGLGVPVETCRMDDFISLPSGVKLPSRIVELTNITDEMLDKQGIPMMVAVRRFLQMVYGETKQKGKEYRALLIAHNAQFDAMFLRRALSIYMSRHKIKNLGIRFDFLDTLTIYRDRHAYPHKLDSAIYTYGLENIVKNSHRAIDDVLALWEVIQAMDAECPDLEKYVNIFGFNPKYGVSGTQLKGITYLSQDFYCYERKNKLYMQCESAVNKEVSESE